MAEGTPDWESDPETWDTLILGTQKLPGAWDIEDGKVARLLDIKKSPGRDGATIKDQGYENGALVCRGQMLAKHWDEMQRIATALKLTQKGKSRTPLAIHHPKALYLGITRVYVTEIEIPRVDTGIMTASIRVLEYLDKPKGTGAGKDKQKFSLEVEVARAKEEQATQPWLAPHMTDQDIIDQSHATEDLRRRQEAGEVPKFKANKPQYAPAP